MILFGGIQVMKTAAVALFLLPVVVSAQAAQVDSPHVHGTGTLSVAFSGADIQLSLVVPGADIVGFERPAENDDDRAQVAGAVSDLSKPMELFVAASAAGCFTMTANVTLTSERLDQGEGADAQAHMEFVADYQVRCQDITQLNRVEFAYFDRFPNASRLDIQISCGGANRIASVSRAEPIAEISCEK